MFTTRVFAVFAFVALPLFYAIPARFRVPYLVAVSLVFFAWGDVRAVPLMLATIAVGWACARMADVDDPARRARWTAASLIGSLGALAFFKYWNFALDTLAALSSAAHHPIDTAFARSSGWLPIGISFYTFHVVSYAIDVYRKKIPAERSLAYLALYVAYYPQLVAGPVERATHMLPQFHAPIALTRADVRDGVLRILLGFVKKLVIADRLAGWIAPRFHDPVHNGLVAWVGVLLFTADIYCDFSAYSDIAIGLARLMGYNIRENFDLPFIVPSIPERWRRWHISMGTFFRDYVYVPLGGSRRGWVRTQVNVMIVMFLSGLWHGASATFVVWGLLNGASMVAHAVLRPILDPIAAWTGRRPLTRWAWFYACCTATLGMIASINVFFRSDSFRVAKSYVRAMYGSPAALLDQVRHPNLPPTYVTGLAWLIVIIAVHEAERHGGIYARVVAHPLAWGIAAIAMLAAVLLYGVSGGHQFIYYQF